MSSPVLQAPWTADQVASINQFQRSWRWHPFTCGRDKCQGILRAAPDGLSCPECDYQQGWVHPFMADWSWDTDGERFLRGTTT